MRKVKAIAVYDPGDSWESAIQDAAKLMTGNWLPAYPCQLLSQAIAALKLGTDWLDRSDLLRIRASHLFSPQLTESKQKRVFATHLLFLRDILENQEINSNLHEPISFLSAPLAHFLFRNFPVHVHVDEGRLRDANPKVNFLDVGGLMIVREGSIHLKEGIITDIRYFGRDPNKASVIINEIQHASGCQFMKAAATEIDDDVFKIDEHFKDIRPESYIWDKIERSKAQVTETEPGENGLVYVKYLDGKEMSVPKQEFDLRFIII